MKQDFSQPTAGFDFILNGKSVHVEQVSSQLSLLEYLRSIGLTGSKEGCNEGDCGACTVGLIERNGEGKPTLRAINSCITLLPTVAGRELLTVEALADDQLHPVQRCMVEHYGSQCGYCTPGFVVSMVEGYLRGTREHWQIADQLCGNLCRCTGYRPIRDAMREAFKHRGKSDRLDALLAGDAPPPPPAAYESAGRRFFRPRSLEELFALLAEYPAATLVGGSTEIGVWINKKFADFPTLIAIETVDELKRIDRTDSDWRIGGAATLTEIEERLGDEYPSLKKMLSVFASRQIRNRATMAGNLVTASPIGDCAPVLLSLDARIELRSGHAKRIVAIEEFFVGYRQTTIRKGEILTAILLPRNPAGHCQFYKVSKRRELDISIVAAAFRVDIDTSGLVRQVRLAYGGVAPTPVRARKTEEALLGQPWTRATIERIAPILEAEFKPISDLRGSAAFRRGLVISLVEKFITGEESFAQDKPLSFLDSGGRIDSSASADRPDEVHMLPANASGTEKTRFLAHESSVGHVTGRAAYVDDEAAQRPMLEIWPVRAPHAHAKIRARDATAARAMPGVIAILLAEDIPGDNDVGAVRPDEILLADKEVFYHGHMVAVVVATSRDAARRAAEKVMVTYEPLPAIVTIEEAIRQQSFHTDCHRMHRGQFESALAASAQRLEGEFSMGGQEHFYLETHAAWAERGDGDDIFVSSSTQHPSEIQAVVAKVLGIRRHQVVVQSPRMGGGFGGKETQANTWAALAAVAAWRTKQPVRVRLDRDLDIQLTGKRHPFLARFKVGFESNGRINAVGIDLWSNGGWSLDLSEPVLDRAMFHLDNVYYLPNVEFTGRVAKTHLASNTAFRGFGGPQGMLVIEEIMDRVARKLGLPPDAVREGNLYRGSGETNTTHYGEEIGDNRILKIWQALKVSSEFDRRHREIAEFNRGDSRIKRGLSITGVKFGISFTKSAYNQAGALVLIYQDGTVQVNHGGTEMGQGLYTKILGIACRELGLSPARVRVMKTRTDKVPNTSATAASSGSDLNGAAVRDACEILRARLASVALNLLSADGPRTPSEPPATLAPAIAREVIFGNGRVIVGERSASFDEVVTQAYTDRISLSATGYYFTPNLHYDKTTGRGHPFHYYACGAAVSEVEVDGYSGMNRVLRVDILHDAGNSLNPGIDRGQIEGGFVQGMGWLTREELGWDEQGCLLTHSASTYQIPAISDAPMDFRVTLLPEATQANVVHGSKAVGEPPLMLAISVREALRDAVSCFGDSRGLVDLPSPATCEAIFLAIQNRQSRPSDPSTRGSKENSAKSNPAVA